MTKFLDLRDQYARIRADVDAAITSVLDSATFVGGAPVKAFESAFAAYQGARHCVAVGNGTDAIEIAIEALELPPGSEIIVPANSFIATSEAVSRSGHRVVFCDCDAATYTLDPDDLARRITDRTAAVIAVHLYGQPCDMDAILAQTGPRGIRVIEDCAQAHGAEYHGRRVGAIGDVGAFSFYPGKNLGAYGDGGALVTNDDGIAQRARMIANHGRLAKYDHAFEGRNSRLDTLQAAILLAKLPHLDEWTERRIAVADAYDEALAGAKAIVRPARARGVRHVYHLYVIRTSRREDLRAALAARGIETGVHYPVALPKLQAYASHPQNAEQFRAGKYDGEVLSLPMGDHLTAADARAVAAAVREIVGE